MRLLVEAVNGGEVLAHGIGGRSDLPVAPWLATYAGVAVVAVSFFAATALWSRSRWSEDSGTVRLTTLQRFVDAPATLLVGRITGVLLLGLFLAVAVMGPDDFGRMNPAPTWFYAWFWSGLVPLSLLFGPVWRRINPLRTFATLGSCMCRRTPSRLPDALGLWPAAVSLLAFLWLELVYDEAASPRLIACFVLCYVVVHAAAGFIFGPLWFERGDGFEVYATMVAQAAPVGRDGAGHLVLRNPLRGIARAPVSPGLTPVVVVILGSTVFDGASRSNWWSGLIADTGRTEYLLIGTLGLAGAITVIASSFGGAMLLTQRFAEPDTGRVGVAARFAPSLIPIAIGYTVAHYLSFAVFQGQQGYLLANDPLGRGWDLFGLSGATVDYTVVSTSQLALLQIAAIVVGHVVAVLSAHDRSLEILRRSDGMRGQYPLMVVMIAYTGGGIILLAGG